MSRTVGYDTDVSASSELHLEEDLAANQSFEVQSIKG